MDGPSRDRGLEIIMESAGLPDPYEALRKVLALRHPNRVLTVVCPRKSERMATVYRVPNWRDFPPIVLAVHRATGRTLGFPGGLLIAGKGQAVQEYEHDPSLTESGQHPGHYYTIRSRGLDVAGWLGAGVVTWEFQCRCTKKPIEERGILGSIAAGRKRHVAT